jgi:hypothetical protein
MIVDYAGKIWITERFKINSLMFMLFFLLIVKGTYDKSSGVIALCWFSKVAAWQPYLKFDRTEIR